MSTQDTHQPPEDIPEWETVEIISDDAKAIVRAINAAAESIEAALLEVAAAITEGRK